MTALTTSGDGQPRSQESEQLREVAATGMERRFRAHVDWFGVIDHPIEIREAKNVGRHQNWQQTANLLEILAMATST